MQDANSSSDGPEDSFRPPIGTSAGGKKFLFLTAADLDAEGEDGEETDWLVEEYVARGSITDLIGAAKEAGKTRLLTALSHAVIEGIPFLGRPTRPSKVVYLTEERKPSFKEALSRAGLLGDPDFTILFWQYAWGESFSSIIRRACQECDRLGAHLLVVDTINQFAGFKDEDENHSGPVLKALRPLQEAAGDGLAVIIGRHANKAGGGVVTAGRGSSAFTGAADIELLLQRPGGNARDTVRELHALSRFSETPDLLVIELTAEGYVAHGSRTDAQATLVREAVLTALRGVPAGGRTLALDDLLMLLPMDLNRRTAVQHALKDLVSEGAVVKEGRGVKGDPHRYRLAEIHSAASTP